MSKAELGKPLHHADFRPFEVLSTSGARYPVVHRDFALIGHEGAIHIDRPGPADPHDVEFLGAVSLLHVASIEFTDSPDTASTPAE